MSFHTVIDNNRREKMLRWLQGQTSIRMESGADVWPFSELDNYHGDIVVKASSAGIAIIIPLRDTVSQAAGIGRQVEPRIFCQKILSKYATKSKIQDQTTPKMSEQLNIKSIKNTRR